MGYFWRPMSHQFSIEPTTDRSEIYRQLLPQVEALLSTEPDTIANMANLCSVLKEHLRFLWVGFYLVKNDELVLGPFQGPVACTRIAKGKGVCGTAWEKNETILVPDVDEFPGHIACSPLSRSEIVIPLADDEGNVWAVLDVDSLVNDDFSPEDTRHLSEMLKWIKPQTNS